MVTVSIAVALPTVTDTSGSAGDPATSRRPNKMWIFDKRIEDVAEADLRTLIQERVRESVTLEYKGQMYGGSDAETREMLRDITSLANAIGGLLIIGMVEDADGSAANLAPIPGSEGHAGRIIASCAANVAERIPGLRAVPVPIVGGHAILVHVPPSYRKPHMITFQGATEFWIRHDRQKSRMSIAEIRAAVTQTEELEMRAERFIAQRLHEMYERTGTLSFSVTATPLLLEAGRVDTSEARLVELVKNPPTLRPRVGVSLSHPTAHIEPTLRGVRATVERIQTLELFRNGHVEFYVFEQNALARDHPPPDGRTITNWVVAEHVRNLVHLVQALRQLTGLTDPYLIAVALNRCHGFRMHENIPDRFGRSRPNEWNDGQHLRLDPIAATIDDAPDQVVRRILDRLWNAFHFQRCPFFDPAGRFQIPEAG